MGQSAQKLRIAVLVETSIVPIWVLTSIRKILSSDKAELVAVLYQASCSVTGLRACIKEAAYRLDQRLYQQANDALRAVSLDTLQQDFPDLTWKEVELVADSTVRPEKEKALNGLNLDVIISYIPERPQRALLSSTRVGVWAHYFGGWSNRGQRDIGLAEVVTQEDVMESGLYDVNDTKSSDSLLYHSYSATHTTSIYANNNPVYWKAASYGLRAILAYSKTGATRNLADSRETEARPGNSVSAGRLLAHVGSSLVRKIDRRFHFEQWMLMAHLGDELSLDFKNFQEIIPPKDRYWADPFVMKHGDSFFIFFEELYYAEDKGHISVIELTADGRVGPVRPVLKRPYHLSYPFLFTVDETLYMMPESNGNRSVEIYRCVSFPDQWTLERVLLTDITAVDATLLERDGRWWLFANVEENAGGTFWDELCVFSTDSLFDGTFHPHPGNPVISDVRRSRPAGAILKIDGELYRVSQICSRKGYGYGLNLNKIIELSDTEYREERVKIIPPDWKKRLCGVHTLNYTVGCTVIDALIKRSRFSS